MRATLAPGGEAVDSDILCVLTRFGLRSPRHLVPTYLDYRRVAKAAEGSPGLLQSAFLVEGTSACYSLSFWTHPGAIPSFGASVHEHVTAGRRVFSRLSFDAERGPEIWSSKWRLASVSRNLNWDDFDLGAAVAAERRASGR